MSAFQADVIVPNSEAREHAEREFARHRCPPGHVTFADIVGPFLRPTLEHLRERLLQLCSFTDHTDQVGREFVSVVASLHHSTVFTDLCNARENIVVHDPSRHLVRSTYFPKRIRLWQIEIVVSVGFVTRVHDCVRIRFEINSRRKQI